MRFYLPLLILFFLCPCVRAQNTSFWEGDISSDWTIPGNWVNDRLPTATDTIYIGAVAGGSDPVIMTGASIGVVNVGIQENASLTVETGATLTLAGAGNYGIYNQGTFDNAGNLVIGATNSSGYFGVQNFGTVTDGTNNYTITYSGGDGNDVVLIADLAPLPVELISFTGRTETKHNVLEWTSAREENFSHYALERSPDGNNNWVVLGHTESARKGASWEDQAPPATAYYRLRSVDTDGTFTLSNMVLLERETADKLIVYPNPSKGFFSVVLPTDAVYNIELFSLHGRLLKSATARNGRYEQHTDLPAGSYLLVATGAAGRWTRRLIVRR